MAGEPGEKRAADEVRRVPWYRERLPERDDLLELLGDEPAATLVVTAKSRAVADGTISVTAPDDQQLAAIADRAAGAVAKLSAGDDVDLSEDDRAALDLVVLIVARPALFVQGERVAQPPPNWPAVEADHALIEANLRGVGCILKAEQAVGTAVLVDARLMLTNNHVVCGLLGLPFDAWEGARDAFAKSVDESNMLWTKTPGAAPEVDFLRELGGAEKRRVRVARVAGTHANADLAILELDAEVANTRVVALHPSEPKLLVGGDVYAIGYPVVDCSQLTPLFLLEQIFGATKTLSTKRLSPGRLKGLDPPMSLRHDASTLNGSSGSALFDFDTHEMIGLHHAGSFRAKANYAVPMWKLVADVLLGKNGIRFSGSVR